TAADHLDRSACCAGRAAGGAVRPAAAHDLHEPRCAGEAHRRRLPVDRHRIHGRAVSPDFEMEVRPGGEAGAADIADQLAGSDRLSGTDGDAAHVAVYRLQSRAMPEPDDVSVARLITRGGDDAGR